MEGYKNPNFNESVATKNRRELMEFTPVICLEEINQNRLDTITDFLNNPECVKNSPELIKPLELQMHTILRYEGLLKQIIPQLLELKALQDDINAFDQLVMD